jgi:hypothetical protein
MAHAITDLKTARKALEYYALRAVGTTNEHWCRFVMNRECLEIVKSLNPERLDALEVSGIFWRDRVPFHTYTSLCYPDFDICNEKTKQKYSFIVAEQVFEHLSDPRQAARNVFEMLAPQGYFLITTPFLLKIHPSPLDCTRWTGQGLKYLLIEAGFDSENLSVFSWGNKACVKSNLKQWTLYNKFIHSLRNEDEFPVVVWAIAQK